MITEQIGALLSMKTSVIIYKYLPGLVGKTNSKKAHAASVQFQKGLSSSLQSIHTLIYLITQSRGQELIYIFNSSFHPWQRRKDGRRKRGWEEKRKTLQYRWMLLWYMKYTFDTMYICKTLQIKPDPKGIFTEIWIRFLYTSRQELWSVRFFLCFWKKSLMLFVWSKIQ